MVLSGRRLAARYMAELYIEQCLTLIAYRMAVTREISANANHIAADSMATYRFRAPIILLSINDVQ